MAEEVVQREIRVTNREGLHARPAAKLVELANRFESQIDLVKQGKRVDAKSIMDLMTLAAEQGSILLLEVRGPDARAAAEAIEKSFQEGLGDVDANPSIS
jgi:phosphotransferase system HPr (HPr) family protein